MLNPLRDFVLVELEADAPQSGAIVVVRSHASTSGFARILAIGPEVREARVGARCVVSRLQGIALEGAQVVLPESAILAYIKDAQSAFSSQEKTE